MTTISHDPLTTVEQYETIEVLSSFVARCALFAYMGLAESLNWDVGLLYRILGFFRWQSGLMWLYFTFRLFKMPSTQRMVRVVILAFRDSLPWSKALFELFWGGTAAFCWSYATYLSYKYVPPFKFFSTPLWVIRTLYDYSSYYIPLAIALYALHRRNPNTWTTILRTFALWFGSSFSLLARSPFFPLLVRLTHICDGAFVNHIRQWQRRNVQVARQDPSSEPQKRETYQYSPVGQSTFRLLRVRRAWVVAQIECELIPFDLNAKEAPDYTAVSYAWGPDPSKPRVIGVDGKVLQVTESAFQVVQSLAPAQGENFIWVDFICINQEDIVERAEQVKLMGQIYRYADKVKINLNTVTAVDYDDSDLVAHHLKKLNKSLKNDTRDFTRLVADFEKAGTRNVTPGWAATSRLLEREYWNRAWVVQEIAMAQKLVVVYADNELAWDDLSALAYAFHDPGNGATLDVLGTLFGGGSIPIQHIMKIVTISDIRNELREGGGLTFHDLFYHGIKFNASDPRDNIYAFLGLTREPNPPQIAPNYSISALELFLRATKVLLSTPQPLWFLNYSGRGYGDRSTHSRFCTLDDKDLPSWLPNWSLCPRKSHYAPLRPAQQGEHLIPSIDDTGKYLTVHACEFDTIELVCNVPYVQASGEPVVTLPTDPTSLAKEMGVAFKTFLDAFNSLVPDPHPQGIPREEIAWRTLLGSKTTHPEEIALNTRSFALLEKQAMFVSDLFDRVSAQNPSTQQENSAVIEGLTTPVTSLLDQKANADPEERRALVYANSQFVFKLGNHCAGRKIGFTKQGHMCLVPHLTRPGDQIYYFAHGQTPFVLRIVTRERVTNESSPSDTFELMGDCYVHDMELEDVQQAGNSLRALRIV